MKRREWLVKREWAGFALALAAIYGFVIVVYTAALLVAWHFVAKFW